MPTIQPTQKSDLLTARLLSPGAAARYLGLSKSSLDHARLTGDLLGHPTPPFVRCGRAIRYPLDGLEAWLAALPRHHHHADEARKRV